MHPQDTAPTERRHMDTDDAIKALKELQAARPLLGEWAVAERATQILDRAGLAPLHVEQYLFDKGHDAREVTHLVGMFASAVKLRFENQYGTRPLTRIHIVAGAQVRINAYIELDRPLMDAAYAEVLALKEALS